MHVETLAGAGLWALLPRLKLVSRLLATILRGLRPRREHVWRLLVLLRGILRSIALALVLS
jgi:hypothetical protein